MPICCYCERAITTEESGAVSIGLVALWPRGDGAAQELFAHSSCLAERFAPTLGANIPFDASAFEVN